MWKGMKRVVTLTCVTCMVTMLIGNPAGTGKVQAEKAGIKSLKNFTVSYVDRTGGVTDLSADLDANFKAYRTKNYTVDSTVGSTVASVWNQSAETSVADKDFKNSLLTPKHVDRDNQRSLLVYTGETPGNCQIRAEIAYHSVQYGIALIDKSVLDSGTINLNDQITVRQTINENGNNILRIRGMGLNNGFPNLSDFPEAKVDATTAERTYKLNVEVKDGKLKTWVEGCQTVSEVALPAGYDMKEKAIAVFSSGGNNGGFKNLTITELSGAYDDYAMYQSLDSAAFSGLSEKFVAYQFLNDGTVNEEGAVPSTYWNINGENQVGNFQIPGWLIPNHRRSANKLTTLTLKDKTVQNFEAGYTFMTAFTNYGIMVAPEGKLANSGLGLQVWLSGEGEINLSGAYDTTSVQRTGADWDGKKLKGFVSPANNKETNKTAYTIHVLVDHREVTVWLDGFEDSCLTAKLTEEYTGGALSIYSNGCDQGGFQNFFVKEYLADDEPEEPVEGEYVRRFTTLSNLSELTDDFAVYTLDDIANKMEEAAIADVFKIERGRLQSNLPVSGSDSSNFGILTLKTQEYKNFELELKYEQGYVRYGVMFGTKMGEFAFDGTGNAIRGKDGGLFVYTEAEGYRSARGSLVSESYSNASLALARHTDDPLLPSFCDRGSVGANLQQRVVHTMVIRVVNDCVTVVVDGNEDSRMTLRLDGYNGGYVSLVTNARYDKEGSFHSFKIRELSEDAELGAPEPERKEGFSSMMDLADQFDAWYLADAAVSTTMEKVDVKENWWINNEGFVARDKEDRGSEYEKVDVLTYKKQKYTDFELTYTMQQTFHRTGIIIGTEAGQFPLGKVKDNLTAKGGIMLFVEAEGCTNAMGDFTSGYTNESQVRQRLDYDRPGGFTDEKGDAGANVQNKVSHQIKIVVKDRELFVFIDNSSEYSMYLTLPESYNGGYVSIFSSAPRTFGIDKFEISENITTAIPGNAQITREGGSMGVVFDKQKLDTGAFAAYYLKELDEKGSLQPVAFQDHWMIANGSMTRKSNRVAGSDIKDVSVLTYTERQYTDFIATFEYKKTPGRLMLMFGTENGSYPIYEKNGNHENGGVILYPENDLGNPGGICAIGDVKLATTEYRPLYQEIPYAPGYHYKKANGQTNVGDIHTMTVAVIDRHVSVYLDDYGMIASFDLTDDYEGGYISLASTQTNQHGFLSLKIEEIDAAAGNVITDVEQKRDLKVLTGTPLENLPLPDSVTVTTRSGQKLQAGVTWKDCGYDSTVVGEYRFVGTIQAPEGISNQGKISAVLTVRVRDSIGGSKTFWTFDTIDDLQDFKAYFVEDAAKGGAVASDFPLWHVQKGMLCLDRNRAGNGSEKRNLYILTYTGRTYKNFEVELDFSQEYAREMILFGSRKPGQYIDYANPHSDENPIAAFVEFEGRRSAIGNVINTNFYARTDENVPFLHEDVAENPRYYNAQNPKENVGNMHKLRLRVVGDTISMWLDDQKEVFTGKLGEGYEGGYISLVSAVKTVSFDNFKITELDEKGNPIEDNREVVANGTLHVNIDKNASTESVKPEKTETDVKPGGEDKAEVKKTFPVAGVVAGTCVALAAVVGSVILVVCKKRKKSNNSDTIVKRRKVSK